jgi:oxygen-independent coproporphyrinogen-3 oxidase
VHFPYCLEKCPYCDFVSFKVAPRDIDHHGYADAVCRELQARAAGRRGPDGTAWRDEVRIASVFFGGGTPSLWAPSAIARVLDAIRATLPSDPDLEITAECNPTSVGEAQAEGLLEAGVNRFSVGIQALDDDRLRYLGRKHTAREARATLSALLHAGARRVSADLIFGLPGQSPDSAVADARALRDLGLMHLSCYQLTIEPGTRFGELARRGRLPLAEEGAVAESFQAVSDALEEAGLRHYEVSNYAERGEEARHNIGYWRGQEYLGLGCGAYGFMHSTDIADGAPSAQTDGTPVATRYRNSPSPDGYVAATADGWPEARADGSANEGPPPWQESAEPLDGNTLFRERLMLGLRMAEGVDLVEAARGLGVEPWTRARTDEVARLIARGRLTRERDTLRIPRGAWLFADDTAARLF